MSESVATSSISEGAVVVVVVADMEVDEGSLTSAEVSSPKRVASSESRLSVNTTASGDGGDKEARSPNGSSPSSKRSSPLGWGSAEVKVSVDAGIGVVVEVGATVAVIVSLGRVVVVVVLRRGMGVVVTRCLVEVEVLGVVEVVRGTAAVVIVVAGAEIAAGVGRVKA